MVQDIPGFVKSHLTKIIFEKFPCNPHLLKKNPTNEKYSRSEKWFYTNIVFILNEENKLQYLKWFILRNLTERSGLQKKLKILNSNYSNFWTQIDICVPVFKAALLTIVRRWNFIDRWTNNQHVVYIKYCFWTIPIF